ncbi:MAG: WD40 repeat domain-containing protein [Pirellulaceae bacterium]
MKTILAFLLLLVVGCGESEEKAQNQLSGETEQEAIAVSDELINTLTGHSAHVSRVAFSPDGKRIVSGSFDDTLKIWDVRK